MCDGKREMTRQEMIDLQNKLTNECAKLKVENAHLRVKLKKNKLQKENEELRARIEKLECDICGGSTCVISESYMFDGVLWIRAATYAEVLLRLKKSNERINKLEAERLSKVIENGQKEMKNENVFARDSL